MDLGAFSISLTVKDIKASRDFYKKLSFKEFDGHITENWLIMKNGSHNIGLFQDMFEKNFLTFNPGCYQDANKLDKFTDLRTLQSQLKKEKLELTSEADEDTNGPASFTLVDPDSNSILFDQHV